MKRILLIIMVLALAPIAVAQAGDPAFLMNKAGVDVANQNYDAAVENLKMAMKELYAAMPLSARNVTFVMDQPQAFGMYDPRPAGPVNSLEPLFLYCEPVGYTAQKVGDWYKYSLSADFAVLDKDGKSLGGQNDFYSWEGQSRAFLTELMFFFTLNLKGLPPGEYTIKITLKDKMSDKKGDITAPVVIQ